MKRIFAVLFGLLLIGAGCSTTTVEGNWYLAFDLPEEWVMVQAYREGDPAEGVEPTLEQIEVFLQSASTHMVFSDITIDEEEQTLIGRDIQRDDMMRVSVLRLDERRIIPSESEDLGDGWYKLAPCVDAAPEDICEDDGESMTYYFESEEGNKYMMRVSVRGHEFSEVEDVIFTAEEVTLEE